MTKEKEEKALTVGSGSTPAVVIEHALKTGASIDQLEKLLMLQERYDKNEAKKAYNMAMAAFKENPPEIDKDRSVTIQHKTGPGQTKYNHASLYNVTKKISAALSKHGLSATWATEQHDTIFVTCKITHKQGHSEETTLSAPADTTGSKNIIQAIGSTITYLERYTLLALTGLATFDDDDGQAAEVTCIDEKELGSIIDYINDRNVDTAKFCKAFGITEVAKLPKARYDEAVKQLEARKPGGAK